MIEPKQGQPGPGISWAEAALFGLCPCCGERGLYGGMVAFARQCRGCGLEFGRFNVGDGPAALLIMIVGGPIVGLAIWLQLAADPPWWLHVILWPPLTVAGVIGGLRIVKALLLHSEFHRGGGR